MNNQIPISEQIHAMASESFGKSVTEANREEYIRHWFEAAQTLYYEFSFSGLDDQANEVERLIILNRKVSKRKEF